MNPHVNIAPEELDQIEQYLAQRLTGEELSAFEQRLAADPQWREKLKEVQLLSIGIQESGVEQLLKNIHKSTESTNKPKMVSMPLWKKMAAAAILILAAGAGIWALVFYQNPDQKLFVSYFKPEPGLLTTMGSSENYQFEKAMVDYKTGNYRQAINSWEKLRQTNAQSDTLNYFIGVALLADNEPAKAIFSLDKVIASGIETFLDDAYWYKGLALIKMGQKQAAAASLKISQHPQAADLLKQLEQ